MLLLGCRTEPQKPPLAKRLFAVDNKAAAEDQTEALPQALRRKRKRWGPAPLYVDGKFLAMLRYRELHPLLPTIWDSENLPGGELNVLRRFAWWDLFEAHGIDVNEIKSVHFYGGRSRISICDGDEFRRVEKHYRFSYNDGEGGKLRQRPPAGGVKVNTGIDIVSAVVVYVDKEAPTYNDGKIKFSDGRELPVRDERRKLVIPYESGELHGGTRVYVDGKYVNAFRRRALMPELMVDAKTESSPYLMEKALQSMKIDIASIKRIQLWSGDFIAGDWGPDALKELPKQTFRLAQHSRGRIKVDAFQDKILTSLMIYVDLEPAERTDPPANGSDQPHGEDTKPNDSVKP